MGWVLEVTKMFMYISFPVALFHYFHQSNYYEDWLTAEKKKHFPPISKKRNAEVEEFIREFNSGIEMKRLEALEMQEKSKH